VYKTVVKLVLII